MDRHYLTIATLLFARIVTGSVTVSDPNERNAVTVQGTLTLTCTITPLVQFMFWHTPDASGSSVCYCSNTEDKCTLASPPSTRSSCSSDIVNGEFTLTVTNISVSDEGEYKCRHAASESEDNELFITVQVPIMSVEITIPNASQITVNEKVPSDFVCETSPGRPRATIQWYKQLGNSDAVPLPGGDYSTVQSGNSVITRSRLVFIPTRTDNNYRVDCTAYNIDASSIFISTIRPQLIVHYAPDNPPVIKGHTTDSTFYEVDGKIQRLTCSVQGGRPLASLRWVCFNGNIQNKSAGTTVALEVAWTAARANDGNRCTCQSSHPISTGNREVYVVIQALYPPTSPKFTVQGQSVSGQVYVIEGRSVSVTCRSTSSPDAEYTWTPRGSSSLNDVLTLTNVQTNSTGEYTCAVTNKMTPTLGIQETGTNSSSITINILFGPRSPVLRYNSQDGDIIMSPFSAVRGDSFSIYCDAEGNPPPTYKWGSQSANGRKIVVTSIQNSRSLTCTATNEMAPTGALVEQGSNTTVASVAVSYGPSTPKLTYRSDRLPLENGLLYVTKGKTFIVTCDNSDSKPYSVYRWSGAITSQTGILAVNNIDVQSDGNRCKCTASNTMNRTYGTTEIGTNTTDMTIRVLYAPIVLILTDATSVENRVFSKVCFVTPGNPEDTVFKWTRLNDTEVISSPTLHISKITKAHAGTYKCTATNTMLPTGERAQNGIDSKTFVLTVLYSASITEFTINGSAGNGPFIYDENSTITLVCKVDSNPGSLINMTKDNTVLRTVAHTTEAKHIVNKASCFDAGVYSCIASNQYNSESKPSITRQVFIKCPPRPFDSVNNYTYFYALNDSVTLNLTVTAYPIPTSNKWYKQQADTSWTEISSEPSFSGHQFNLTIKHIKEDDFGQYRVDVTNLLGTLEHFFFVAAQDKPQTPNNITTETITDSSAVIRWIKGFNGGLEQTFYIEYGPSSANDMNIKQKSDTDESTLNITLRELSPETGYTVQMYAGNLVGNSSRSEYVMFTTKKKSVSSGNPTNVVPIIAGVAGGIVAAALVVLAIVVFVRKCQCFKGKVRKKDEGLSHNMHNGAFDDDDDFSPVENVNYESADGFMRQNELTAATGDTYATVNKPNNPLATSDVYAQVNLKTPEDLYALPNKNKGGGQVEKKATSYKATKGEDKKAKSDLKKKNRGKGKPPQGEIDGNQPMNQTGQDEYENSQNVTATRTGISDKLYEDVGASAPQQLQREANKDGLIYLQLDFKKDPNKAAENKIYGAEDMTEYGIIDFNKKADPLPDSNEEGKN